MLYTSFCCVFVAMFIFFFSLTFLSVLFFFFFFQAEDGIRDWSVTGVQTCALPIFTLASFISLGDCSTVQLRPCGQRPVSRLSPGTSMLVFEKRKHFGWLFAANNAHQAAQIKATCQLSKFRRSIWRNQNSNARCF